MSDNALRLVFWEATVACNLECVHCRRLEISKTLSREDLTTQQALDFIKSLARDFAPPPVLVFSGGEPLARGDIFDLIRAAAQFEVPTALATNGTLIDQALAREIADSGLRRVSISLDGASASTHDQFRKMRGSFDRAVQGFRFLRSLGMSMQLNATLTRHNIRELDAIYRLALELGAESLHYFLLVPVGCGLEIKEYFQLSAQEYEDALHRIYEQACEEKIHIRPICAPHYFRILAQKKSPFLKKDSGRPGMNQITKGCLAGSGICFVSHKGQVFPCGYLPIEVGNIQRQRLIEIWESSDTLNALRSPDFLTGKCGVCEYKRICFGCRARAFEEYDDFLAEEPNCLYQPKSSS